MNCDSLTLMESHVIPVSGSNLLGNLQPHRLCLCSSLWNAWMSTSWPSLPPLCGAFVPSLFKHQLVFHYIPFTAFQIEPKPNSSCPQVKGLADHRLQSILPWVTRTLKLHFILYAAPELPASCVESSRRAVAIPVPLSHLTQSPAPCLPHPGRSVTFY